ncbi:hypothetical protein GCM10027570_40960 [Streptomonospora sediminis]
MGTGAYEAPAVTELGDFADQTGAGLGFSYEGFIPYTSRD